MEYLVTMTTHVPDGTPEQAVDDIRAREARRARELAAEGHILRLWRPPLRPGEWRSLGLFAAADDERLEKVLASMPLRVWRTDEVTPLRPHPNDPAPGRGVLGPVGAEFLTTFTVSVPSGTSAAMEKELRDQEARRARELAAEGRLLRLWTLPGDQRNLGQWQVTDADQMRAVVASLPLARAGWMTTDTVAVTRHPNDPAVAPMAC
jgi:muconolactone delta-isomerase